MKPVPFPKNESIMKALIYRAMLQADDLVIVFDYVDQKGNATRRVVSPIRFASDSRFLGLCLSREEPRQFELSRCRTCESTKHPIT